MGRLDGVSVLVTRPAGQAAGLISRIEALGGEALFFPAIEIQAPRNPASLRILPKALQYADLAIFTSVNSVDAACRRLSEAGATLPESCLVAAVGGATANRLSACRIDVDLLPATIQSSEGLLALPELQVLTDASVVILRGEGGRSVLGRTLRERGAVVTFLECYRRGLPTANPAPLIERWRRGGVDLVTATSRETVRNLVTLLGEAGRSLLLATPIVVISERVADYCDELNWRGRILIAGNPSDEDFSAAIVAWRTG